MKKSLLFLHALLLFAGFAGCGDTEKPAALLPESIEVHPKALGFDKNEASGYFSIVSNTEWIISCSEPWLTCTPASGEGDRGVTLSIAANDDAALRTATILVTTAGGASESVQVTQGGLEPFIILIPDAQAADPLGEEMTVAVTAYSAWTVQIPADAGWVTLKSQTETQAVFTVAANTSEEERSTVITFKLDEFDKQVTFHLTQDDGLFLTVNPAETVAFFTGGDITIAVDAFDAWTAQIPTDAGWVSLKSQTATQAVFAIAANPSAGERSTVITFKLNGFNRQATLTLKQPIEMQIPGESDGTTWWSPWGNGGECVKRGDLFDGDLLANFSYLYDGVTWVDNPGFWNGPTQGPGGWAYLDTYLPGGAPTALIPGYYTIDMGRSAIYSKFKKHYRWRNPYGSGPHINEFELWGTDNPKPLFPEVTLPADRLTNLQYWTNWPEVGGTDAWKSDWVKLGEYTVRFPSNPTGFLTQNGPFTSDDVAFFQAGFEFVIDPAATTVPCRYLRFVCKRSNWADGTLMDQPIEFQFWGQVVD